jgi:hypothetical protein
VKVNLDPLECHSDLRIAGIRVAAACASRYMLCKQWHTLSKCSPDPFRQSQKFLPYTELCREWQHQSMRKDAKCRFYFGRSTTPLHRESAARANGAAREVKCRRYFHRTASDSIGRFDELFCKHSIDSSDIFAISIAPIERINGVALQFATTFVP